MNDPSLSLGNKLLLSLEDRMSSSSTTTPASDPHKESYINGTEPLSAFKAVALNEDNDGNITVRCADSTDFPYVEGFSMHSAGSGMIVEVLRYGKVSDDVFMRFNLNDVIFLGRDGGFFSEWTDIESLITAGHKYLSPIGLHRGGRTVLVNPQTPIQL